MYEGKIVHPSVSLADVSTFMGFTRPGFPVHRTVAPHGRTVAPRRTRNISPRNITPSHFRWSRNTTGPVPSHWRSKVPLVTAVASSIRPGFDSSIYHIPRPRCRHRCRVSIPLNMDLTFPERHRCRVSIPLNMDLTFPELRNPFGC